MPDFCVSGRCANTSDVTDVSLHLFPKSASQYNAWIAFVRGTRCDDEWVAKASSRLCSAHFTPKSFKNWDKFRMGFSKKLMIKPEAVPGDQTSIIPDATPDPPSERASEMLEWQPDLDTHVDKIVSLIM